MYSDFKKFAKSNHVSSTLIDSYNPMVIEERKSYAATYDIFSRLLNDRIIFLNEVIDSEISSIIQAQLLYLEFQSNEPITMYINSPGGSVDSGLAIYDVMQLINSKVYTLCTGLAASMASILLAAGDPGHRFALPHSRILIHQVMGGAYGQETDVTIAAKELERRKQELSEILAKHSNKSVEQIIKDTDRDYWMSAKEAKDYGIIDIIK